MPLAFGLAIGVPCFVGYNHLVSVVGGIVLDMEKAGLSALQMVSEMKKNSRKDPAKSPGSSPKENPDLFGSA